MKFTSECYVKPNLGVILVHKRTYLDRRKSEILGRKIALFNTFYAQRSWLYERLNGISRFRRLWVKAEIDVQNLHTVFSGQLNSYSLQKLRIM